MHEFFDVEFILMIKKISFIRISFLILIKKFYFMDKYRANKA